MALPPQPWLLPLSGSANWCHLSWAPPVSPPPQEQRGGQLQADRDLPSLVWLHLRQQQDLERRGKN